MGKNLWRELKHRYNVTELVVPEPQEEDVSPLKVNRKRKRGEKEVGGTSGPLDAEEVTSKAADAGAVDLTASPAPKETPQVAAEEMARVAESVAQAAEVVTPAAEQVAPSTKAGVATEGEVQVAEQVAQAAMVGDAVETPAAPGSVMPEAGVPVAEQGMSAAASATAEVQGKGPGSEVPMATPAAFVPSSGPSQGASQGRYIAHHFGKDRSDVCLDHVSASADMNSLWSAGVIAERFFPKGSLSSEDQEMIEEAGPVESFDVAQVLLQRATTIMDHWKHRWSKQQEDLVRLRGRVRPLRDENKVLREENKVLSAALGEAKLQGAELGAARGDLARVQKSLEIALCLNENYASQVGELQGLAASSRSRVRPLEDKEMSSRGRVRSLEDEVTSLKSELVTAAEKRLLLLAPMFLS
ncbi:uncharacterized protein LOC114915866 [Cajanus cajan]|uniref:uncharacterized protein LOC114915866 n=1 Tax=Cajanus cajan TaxID=3821 RepID=UPI0010FBBDAD|nr:uncharacterized protein LOC114915866 [Cajanus cajan]